MQSVINKLLFSFVLFVAVAGFGHTFFNATLFPNVQAQIDPRRTSGEYNCNVPPRLFGGANGTTLINPIQGNTVDKAEHDEVWVAYEITNPSVYNNNPGIHWCWRNTQGTGLGAYSCQAGSIGNNYLPDSNGFRYTDESGKQYVAARFTEFNASSYDMSWEVAPWSNTGSNLGSRGFGERQCINKYPDVIRATNSFTCNGPGAAWFKDSNTGRYPIAITVPGEKLDRNRSYVAIVKLRGQVARAFHIPLNREDSGNYTAGGILDNPGTYDVVITLTNSGDIRNVAGNCGELGGGLHANIDMSSCQAHPNCLTSFTIDPDDESKVIDFDSRNTSALFGEAGRLSGHSSTDPFSLCNQVIGDAEKQACELCVSGQAGTGGAEGIWTAFGCISTDGSSTMRSLIAIAMGMAGGFGLLLIIGVGGMFAMSKNDPKKVGDAKEWLESIVIGLIFIVFSVIILQFIGVTILRIPGFG